MNTIVQPVTSHFNHYFALIKGSKKPEMAGWQNSPAADDHPSHYGIALQITELVLDFDPKYYPPDPISAGKLKLEAEVIQEWKLPRSRTVKTPSGGRHLYYTIPEGKKIRFEQPHYGAMINFLTKGRYVAGPGSVTAEGIYELEDDTPVAALPEAFYNWLQKASADARKDAAIDAIEKDDDRAVLKYENWLKVAAPVAVSGDGGDGTTLHVAMYGRDLGLTLETTSHLMWEHYNRRCEPRWFESELDRKVQNAYRYAKGKQGRLSPVRLVDQDRLLQEAAPVETPAVKEMKALRYHHLATEYVLDDKFRPVKNLVVNARLFLGSDPHFKDLFWWDSFRHTLKLKKQAWWRDDKSDEMSREDFLQIYDWINGAAGGKEPYRCELSTIKDAIILKAHESAKHPLQDWLSSIKWDGTARLENLLIDTCSSPDKRWAQIAVRKFLIGCVQRAYEPGSKMDYVLVLQGGQGLRKGMWIDKLGEPWARCGALDPGDKDLDHKMLGTWIMELPEIDQAHIKRDKAKIKDFITRKSDFYRQPYAPAPKDVPRTACFIGTLNPTEMGWLDDETGNRRYWPVRVGDVDLERLAATKDQVFAEAVQYYRQGEKPFFTEAADKQLAAQAQLENSISAPWAILLRGKLAETYSLDGQQAYDLLGLHAREINSTARQKIGRALKELQFTFDRDSNLWTRQLQVLDNDCTTQGKTNGNT